MLTIKRVVESGVCVFCNKSKEVVAVVLDGQAAGEILLCWPDVKKMAQMKMRMTGTGPVALAQPIKPQGNAIPVK